MRALALSLILFLPACGTIKTWAKEEATAAVNAELQERVDGWREDGTFHPQDYAQFQAKAEEAGFTDADGNVVWTKLLTSGNGLGIAGLLAAWALRRRMGKKVGELWAAKSDKPD